MPAEAPALHLFCAKCRAVLSRHNRTRLCAPCTGDLSSGEDRREGRNVPRQKRHQPGTVRSPFAERLAVLRRARGWTQADLAERADTHERTVQGYESGRVQPAAPILEKLADIFGMSMDAIWRGVEVVPGAFSDR